MSKSFKTRLTGSRKKGVRPSRAKGEDWVDCRDALAVHCEDIETLAALLAACGDDVMNGNVARRVGYMVDEHIQQIRALLDKLEAAR
jgi:hypothetical protein